MTIERKMFEDNGRIPVNVLDKFHNLTTEQVRNALESGRSPMVSVCMNLTHDFNKSSVIRAHNAFLGGDLYLVGKRSFDRRGTVGMHHYENIFHADNLEEVVEKLRENSYTVFAVDNTPEFDPHVVYDVEIPERSAFVYGEEQRGLSKDSVDLCDTSVYIPQYGCVRSMNVSQAAAVMMSEYNRRHR